MFERSGYISHRRSVADFGSRVSGDLADQASISHEQFVAVRVTSVVSMQQGIELEEKKLAAAREAGAPSNCKTCGDPIEENRLARKPGAARCKSCQEAFDTEQRSKS